MKCLSWLLLALLPAIAAAGDFGRLLTTPEERARIEAHRQGRLATDGKGAQESERVTVNGVLRASDGRRLVWLNGQPHDGRSRRSPALVRHDGRVRLAFERRGWVLLKPGQTLDKTTGRIYDATEQPPAPTPPEGTEKAADSPKEAP